MCLTSNPNNKVVLAAACDETMFYFDGEYIREATTHQCISTTGTNDYDEVQNVGDMI